MFFHSGIITRRSFGMDMNVESDKVDIDFSGIDLLIGIGWQFKGLDIRRPNRKLSRNRAEPCNEKNLPQ